MASDGVMGNAAASSPRLLAARALAGAVESHNHAPWFCMENHECSNNRGGPRNGVATRRPPPDAVEGGRTDRVQELLLLRLQTMAKCHYSLPFDLRYNDLSIQTRMGRDNDGRPSSKPACSWARSSASVALSVSIAGGSLRCVRRQPNLVLGA